MKTIDKWALLIELEEEIAELTLDLDREYDPALYDIREEFRRRLKALDKE